MKIRTENLSHPASGVSTTICESFVCTKFDTGDGAKVSYLTADMRVECYSKEHVSIMSYAGLMLGLLPVVAVQVVIEL